MLLQGLQHVHHALASAAAFLSSLAMTTQLAGSNLNCTVGPCLLPTRCVRMLRASTPLIFNFPYSPISPRLSNRICGLRELWAPRIPWLFLAVSLRVGECHCVYPSSYLVFVADGLLHRSQRCQDASERCMEFHLIFHRLPEQLQRVPCRFGVGSLHQPSSLPKTPT